MNNNVNFSSLPYDIELKHNAAMLYNDNQNKVKLNMNYGD